MKKNICYFFLFISASFFSQSDTTYQQFIRDSLKIARVKLIRPQFKVDNRQAFHGSQALPINGFDLGVLLSDKLRLTVGYYGMNGNLKEFSHVTSDGQETGRTIRMNYGSINTELIYKNMRFLSLGMPLEIAAGYNSFEDKNITLNQVSARKSGALMFVNFGASGTFKPMRFLGLKGIIGYRKAVFNQVKDFDFDGFFTAIGLNVDVHEIITDIKMFRLMKHYKRGNNISNGVNIITN